MLCVFNNAASGYVKALQHSMFGGGNYQSSDLVEMDYAAIARAMGCNGIRVEDPDAARAARCARGSTTPSTPTVLDIVVTRDPAQDAARRRQPHADGARRATGRCEP